MIRAPEDDAATLVNLAQTGVSNRGPQSSIEVLIGDVDVSGRDGGRERCDELESRPAAERPADVRVERLAQRAADERHEVIGPTVRDAGIPHLIRDGARPRREHRVCRAGIRAVT